MKILVTGGAGYIGSFMAKRLVEDHEVTVVDNVSRGHKEFIPEKAQFLQGDLLDTSFVQSTLSNQQYDAIIHFAGYISMAESMRDPKPYFDNNTTATLNLLECMKDTGQKNIVFSSTAGIYGDPVKVPIPEDHPKNPNNPYGESKYMVERLLYWYAQIHNINSVSLRYFNAAGAALDGSQGEQHNPESHIIPLAIRAALQHSSFTLFGTDYNTPDGTCIRDYIHVLDLVEAHVLAINKLQKDNGSFAYNVGTGKGHSNKEVIEMVKKVSNMDFEVQSNDRRPGDANELVADVSKISNELNFNPKYSDLETIVTSAWKWHSKNEKINKS